MSQKNNIQHIDLLHWKQAYGSDDYTPITTTIINKSDRTWLKNLIRKYTLNSIKNIK